MNQWHVDAIINYERINATWINVLDFNRTNQNITNNLTITTNRYMTSKIINRYELRIE